MKKLCCFCIALFSCLCVSAQIVTIPDANFKTKLLQADSSNETAKNLSGVFFKIDANNDNEIQLAEASQVSYLNVRRDFSFPDPPIASLQGILSFVNLTDLNCGSNELTSLDVGGMSNLVALDCSGNLLSTMNLSGLTNLEILICAGTGNQFGTLDVTSLTNLKTFICAFNGLSSINVSGLTNLEFLNCGFNNFTTLDVSSLTGLRQFFCSYIGALTSLDVRGLTSLQEFTCTGNANLQELQLSQNPLVSLTISDLPNLVTLGCTNTPLIALEVNGFANLQTLNCSGNQLQTLNVNQLSNLQILNCSDNQLTSLYLKNGNTETSLNIADNPDLLYVCADFPQIATVQALVASYGYVSCVVDAACSSGSSDIVFIADPNFKAKLLEANFDNQIAKDLNGTYFKIDVNADAEIQVSEVEQVSYLDLEASGIATLEGISGFVNLVELRCSDNQLNALNLTGLNNLLELHCSDNQLTELNTEVVPGLQILHCNDNALQTLNVNNLSDLQELHCSDNQLTSLFFKNGSNEELEIENNPDLLYICADAVQLSDVQLLVNTSGYSNCAINTYCTFSPGGTLYTIQGYSRLDANQSGCDLNDPTFANAKFSLSNGFTTETLIANTTGLYAFDVEEGNYTLTPILENPDYFSVIPTSATISFSGSGSAFIQDFCYTAIGVHHDLEVTIVPLSEAVPGFDVEYSVIFKNKGNQSQSGTITVTFNDAILDFVSANPMLPNQSSNNLLWNFSNLQPFETRMIRFVLNLNSPMESPAVNDGDNLVYTAAVNSVAADETPNDNTFVLNQGVVNSLDPNDKTCLEGVKVPVTQVGDYVHYMIRFENMGTFPAKNIVIRDMIDPSKFDVSTLFATQGSHDFYTKISENQVEFFFENINLPFTDSNNDGYVVFKIKTKPSLAVGDTFSNHAAIYFDYNFPVATNTAVTIVEALKTQDFDFDDYFILYPNPANTFLNVESVKDIQMNSVKVYNTIGQLILAFSDVSKVFNFDVGALASGHYVIKVDSDKGTSSHKFIKI